MDQSVPAGLVKIINFFLSGFQGAVKRSHDYERRTALPYSPVSRKLLSMQSAEDRTGEDKLAALLRLRISVPFSPKDSAPTAVRRESYAEIRA